jgi:hypothetical protein
MPTMVSAFAALLFCVGPSSAGAAAPPVKRSVSNDMAGEAERVVARWPEVSRQTARLMLLKYGEPSAIGEGVLIWNDNAPWQRTIAYRADVNGLYPRRTGILEQVVSYEVPQNKVAALAKFGGGLKADVGRKELSALNDSEEANTLALNMASEIVVGRLTPAEARKLYDKTLELAADGKSSPLTSELMFPHFPSVNR